MTTEKPAGAYQMLSKSRAMFRGNPLLTLDHLQFFKPIEVPVDVLLQNRAIKETIVVNPLTGVVEVSGIALFSTDRLRNEVYKEDHRVWHLSGAAKDYLKKVTGNTFERVISYHDTKRTVEYNEDGSLNGDIHFRTPFKLNVVSTYIDKIVVQHPDEIDVVTDYDNIYPSERLLQVNTFNPYKSYLKRSMNNLSGYNQFLAKPTDESNQVMDVPYMASRDIVVTADLLDKFQAINQTKVYKYNGEVILQYTPSYFFDDGFNSYKTAEGKLTNNNANYINSIDVHGSSKYTNNNNADTLPDEYSSKGVTSFLQYVPYRYQFTLKDIDIVSFYLDLIAGKLWNKPDEGKRINVNDEKYNKITLTHLNKVYTVNNTIGDVSNVVYSSAGRDRVYNESKLDAYMQSPVKYLNINTNDDSVYRSKVWALDRYYKKSLPIKNLKVGTQLLTFADISNRRYSEEFYRATKTIFAVLPDDTEVNLYKYLVDNDMIPETEEEGKYITLALSQEGDLPVIISYQFTAYPKWWQLVWDRVYVTPAFSHYQQFNYFYKDSDILGDEEKAIYREKGTSVYVEPRQLENNEILVVLPEDAAKFFGQRLDARLPGDKSDRVYIHNFLNDNQNSNDVIPVDNWRFGPNRLTYAEALIELIYGNWNKGSAPGPTTDVVDFSSGYSNPNELLSTITFDNIDMPWWGTISLWNINSAETISSPRYVRSFIDNARDMGLTPMEFWLLISMAFIHGYRTRWVKVKPSLFDKDTMLPTLKRLGNDIQYFRDYISGAINSQIKDDTEKRDILNALSNGQQANMTTFKKLSFSGETYLFDFGIRGEDKTATYIPQQRILNYYWLPQRGLSNFSNWRDDTGRVYTLGGTLSTKYDFGVKTNNNGVNAANSYISNDYSKSSIYTYSNYEINKPAFCGYEVGHLDIFGHYYGYRTNSTILKYTDAPVSTFIGTEWNTVSETLLERRYGASVRNKSYANSVHQSYVLYPTYTLTWATANETQRELTSVLKRYESIGVDKEEYRFAPNQGGPTEVTPNGINYGRTPLSIRATLEKSDYTNDITRGYGDDEYISNINKRGLHLNSNNSVVNLFLAMCYAQRLRLRIGIADRYLVANQVSERIRPDLEALGYNTDDIESYENRIKDTTNKNNPLNFHIDVVLKPNKEHIKRYLSNNNNLAIDPLDTCSILTREYGGLSGMGSYLDIDRFIDKYDTMFGWGGNNKNTLDIGRLENAVGSKLKNRIERLNNALFNHLYGMQGLPMFWKDGRYNVNIFGLPDYIENIKNINQSYTGHSPIYPLLYNQLSSDYRLNQLDPYRTQYDSRAGMNGNDGFIDRIISQRHYEHFKGGYALTLTPWSYVYNNCMTLNDIRYRHHNPTNINSIEGGILSYGYFGESYALYNRSNTFSDKQASSNGLVIEYRYSLNDAAISSIDLLGDSRLFNDNKYRTGGGKVDLTDIYSGDSSPAISIVGSFLSAWKIDKLIKLHYTLDRNDEILHDIIRNGSHDDPGRLGYVLGTKYFNQNIPDNENVVQIIAGYLHRALAKHHERLKEYINATMTENTQGYLTNLTPLMISIDALYEVDDGGTMLSEDNPLEWNHQSNWVNIHHEYIDVNAFIGIDKQSSYYIAQLAPD